MTAFTLFNQNDDHYKQWSQEWSQLDEEAGWLGAGGPLTVFHQVEIDQSGDNLLKRG